MHCLVDFDNIPHEIRKWGVEHIVRRVVQTVEPHLPTLHCDFRVRLYGGWFEAGFLTKSAQLTQAQIDAISPLVILRSDGSHLGLARLELARTLLIDPSTTITHTFRRKGAPSGLQCERRPWINCAESRSCPLAAVQEFLSQDICPNDRCAVGPEDILFKQEQKMVDTMLVADVIHLANENKEPIVVISSDDDLWPGVYSAVLLGQQVLHVRTKSTTSPLQLFKRLKNNLYKSVAIT